MAGQIDYSKIPDQRKAKLLQTEHNNRIVRRKAEKDLQARLGLNYRYFRFDCKGKEVSVSFGWKIIKTVDEDVLRYTLTLQSKKDNFSRRAARKIINMRWVEGQTRTVPITTKIKPKSVDYLLAWDYNTNDFSPRTFGILGSIPKYLRRIPVTFG